MSARFLSVMLVAALGCLGPQRAAAQTNLDPIPAHAKAIVEGRCLGWSEAQSAFVCGRVEHDDENRYYLELTRPGARKAAPSSSIPVDSSLDDDEERQVASWLRSRTKEVEDLRLVPIAEVEARGGSCVTALGTLSVAKGKAAWIMPTDRGKPKRVKLVAPRDKCSTFSPERCATSPDGGFLYILWHAEDNGRCDLHGPGPSPQVSTHELPKVPVVGAPATPRLTWKFQDREGENVAILLFDSDRRKNLYSTRTDYGVLTCEVVATIGSPDVLSEIRCSGTGHNTEYRVRQEQSALVVETREVELDTDPEPGEAPQDPSADQWRVVKSLPKWP